MILRIAFLLLLQVGTAPKGSIEGTVDRLGTREPIGDVHVVLMRTTPGEPDDISRRPVFTASTDAQGRYAFKDIEPGTYRLGFAANGYVRQEYGQRVLPGEGSALTLSPGQDMKGLTTELTPTGTVSGTIRDSEKRPVSGMPVQLMRVAYDYEGDRRLRPVDPIAQTDDRGEFRLFFVTPGQYYLSAGTTQGPLGDGDPKLSANEVSQSYSYLYYSGVADARFATTLDVRPGESKTAVDMTLNKQSGVRVSGRVIDSSTGQAPQNAKVRLNYRDPGTGWDYDLEWLGRQRVVYKDGNFEFRNVLPGLFSVSASVDEPRPPQASMRTQPLQRKASAPIEVANRDVEGIVLTLVPGASLTGTLRMDGQDLASAGFKQDSRAGISLEPTTNGEKPSIPGMPTPTYGNLNPDGTFRIDNLMPGEFRVHVNWINELFYVKEARFGPVDVLNTPLRYSRGDAGAFEIVLSSKVASVEGTVTDSRSAPVAGAQVVLVPDQSRWRIGLFETASTDQNGRFSMHQLAPGDYKLYAWEAIELYGWFDPELLKKHESFAKPVRLGESGKQTVDARVIPAN